MSYSTVEPLAARQVLHDSFASDGSDLHTWLWTTYGARLEACGEILEVAAGYGKFWACPAKRIRNDARLVLSDASAAMLRELERTRGRLGFRTEVAAADMCRLPFADASFDGVLMHSALQYATDKRAAIRELRRVARAGSGLVGLLVAGEGNMAELVELLHDEAMGIDMTARESSALREDLVDRLVAGNFGTVTKHVWDPILRITHVEPVLRYMRSISVVRAAQPPESYFQSRRQHVVARLAEDGVFSVTRRQCLYVCFA